MKINKLKTVKRFFLLEFAVVIVIIFAIGLVYNFFVLKPQKEIAELEQNNQKQSKFEICLKDVETQYLARWNSYCKRAEIPKEITDGTGKDCGVPKDVAIHYDSEREKNRDFCLKAYK